MKQRHHLSDDDLLLAGQMIKDGYRQNAIAEKVGCHYGVISRIATGHHGRYNALIAPPSSEGQSAIKQKIEAKLLELIDLLGELK